VTYLTRIGPIWLHLAGIRGSVVRLGDLGFAIDTTTEIGRYNYRGNW